MTMHPMLRFALLFCPRDYRSRYASSIAADAKTRGVDLLAASTDLIYQGVSMHFENLGRDFSFAARTLARSPMYAGVAILAIALAIAANVAIASVLEGVLLRPLPYPRADRIMYVAADAKDVAGSDFSYLDGRDLAAGAKTLQAFGLSESDGSATLTGIAQPVRLEGNDVNDGYFRVLGAQAELGRTFAAADLGTRALIVSDRVWHAYFGGSLSAIGQIAHLDSGTYHIVGVMGPQFRDVTRTGLVQRDYWTALDPRSNMNVQRAYQHYVGWALVKPGVSNGAAQADVNRVMGSLVHRYIRYHLSGWGGAQLGPALRVIVSPVQSLLWMLYAAVALLLIIACANVTNLALVRAAAREGELNVRSALGASRSRLVTQLCVEMSLLAAAGGVLGIIGGWQVLAAFSAIGAQVLPRWESVHVDAAVVAYVVGIMLLTTLVTGLIPALSSQRDLVPGLRSTGRSAVSSSTRLRSALVVAEVALAIAVVVSAGLIVRSFIAVTHVDPGFAGTNLYVADVPGFPKERYPDFASTLRGVGRLERGMRAIAGVVDVAETTVVPFDWGFSLGTQVPGRRGEEDVDGNAIGPGYFRTMRIPLLRGRDFDSRDRFESPQVAIISAAFAKHFFGTLDAIGRTYRPGISSGQKQETRTIVGVVGDTRNGFRVPIAPAQYFPNTQIRAVGRFVIRTNGRDGGLLAGLTGAYRAVDPQFAAPKLQPYREIFAEDSGKALAAALLFGAFAFIALLLALAGVYAVTAYGVEQRTREFGIRKAIGATNAAVLSNVVAGALRQCALGIALGLVLAAISTQLLSAMLFETSPLDPATFAGVVVLLVACAVFAALVPALRATRVAPARALRYE